MPVFSYLAIPAEGEKATLCAALEATEYCEIIPADNQDLVVLITDAPDKETDKRLQAQLKQLSCLQSLSMAYGHADENTTGN
jgi:nitrate reductase NapAB chaperone NapD